LVSEQPVLGTIDGENAEHGRVEAKLVPISIPIVFYQLVLEQSVLGTIDGDNTEHGSEGGGIGAGGLKACWRCVKL